MSLPPPAVDQQFCEISAIDSGSIHRAPLGQFIDVAKVDETADLPCLAFVLRHCRTRDPFVFDLGIRPDPENLAGAIAVITKMGIMVEGRDIPAVLEQGGLSRTDVKHVAISHIHFDHTGVPKAFPNATFLLGAGAKSVIETQGPDFEGTIYAVDVPFERTNFLDPSTEEWVPIGPFPRALDFYGDGSLYIVDAPGHVPGHINVLARTSANGGWVFLAGDSAHDWRLLTGEAKVGHHVRYGCIHEDPGNAQETIERIKALAGCPRVRVLLAHDVPFAKQNAKEGSGYWPDKIVSL
ncbi:Metallo-hydrolase/oxidoreductase [Dichomitus squalens]|uniref:Metallo-hydrolase/oxidoreductase n=1 Tax=Dichomitus squalens TaxID=114155 RepID=A0A4Q9NJF3_9APHY|nr:Metallo-hydrolase/oxidoreductase [Dichomitus squalens]TBU56256.1 Metallo-hydrolase/oxidoreductase [Dichomitus squalens]